MQVICQSMSYLKLSRLPFNNVLECEQSTFKYHIILDEVVWVENVWSIFSNSPAAFSSQQQGFQIILRISNFVIKQNNAKREQNEALFLNLSNSLTKKVAKSDTDDTVYRCVRCQDPRDLGSLGNALLCPACRQVSFAKLSSSLSRG